MTGAVRSWRLQAGDALDRRRVRELFYEMADRLSQVRGSSFGNQVLNRQKFTIDSWEEYDTSQENDVNYRVPGYGHMAPGSLQVQSTREPVWSATLDWSVEGFVTDTKSYLLLGVPMLDHEIVWGAQDLVTADQILQSTVGNYDPTLVIASLGVTGASGDTFGLGGSCHVRGTTAKSTASVLLLSVAGFKITNSQMHLRRMV